LCIKPYLNTDYSFKEVHLIDTFYETHELFTLSETLLRAPDRRLPEGQIFIDKIGKDALENALSGGRILHIKNR
jgi:hypothetical protein